MAGGELVLDAFEGGDPAFGVAAGEDDVGALGGEDAGGLEADAGARTGDDHGAAGLVGNVGGGPGVQCGPLLAGVDDWYELYNMGIVCQV